MSECPNECITNSIIESINKRKSPDFSKCADSRPTESFKPGDIAVGIWFNDPNWYAGKLEYVKGGLGFPIEEDREEDRFGFMEDADHFIKICSKK